MKSDKNLRSGNCVYRLSSDFTFPVLLINSPLTSLTSEALCETPACKHASLDCSHELISVGDPTIALKSMLSFFLYVSSGKGKHLEETGADTEDMQTPHRDE